LQKGRACNIFASGASAGITDTLPKGTVMSHCGWRCKEKVNMQKTIYLETPMVKRALFLQIFVFKHGAHFFGKKRALDIRFRLFSMMFSAAEAK
jgi:hypothetical protein